MTTASRDSWFNRRVLRALVVLSVVAVAVAACSGSGSTGAPAPRPVPRGEAPEEPPARPGGDFERFFLTGDEAGCPSQARGDCRSSAELSSDGTLRMDPWGEPGAPTLSARVPDAALAQAIPALRDPALLALHARPPPCPDSNQTETMLVRIAGTDHQNATGACNEPPIQAARAAILALTSTHFPGHSLISPPF